MLQYTLGAAVSLNMTEELVHLKVPLGPRPERLWVSLRGYAR